MKKDEIGRLLEAVQGSFEQRTSERGDEFSKKLDDLLEEIRHENNLGIADMKLTNVNEDKKIIKYIMTNKTKETFAFNRNEISDATDIPTSHLPYTTMIKIPDVEFILFRGELWFTVPTMKEKILRFAKKLWPNIKNSI